MNARTSRAHGLRSKRSDQSRANTAIAVAFVEIDVQMARIAIAQWRKGRIIADIGKARIVRRMLWLTIILAILTLVQVIAAIPTLILLMERLEFL